jgi:hypothetical protein
MIEVKSGVKNLCRSSSTTYRQEIDRMSPQSAWRVSSLTSLTQNASQRFSHSQAALAMLLSIPKKTPLPKKDQSKGLPISSYF